MRGWVAALAVVALAGPAWGDGSHVPDAPYVWGTGSAVLTSDVYRDGSSPPLNAATPEQGPQASVAVPQGGLELPKGAAQVRVSLEVVPTSGRLDGPPLSNGYALSLADEAGRPLSLRTQSRAAVVLLRAAAAPSAEVVAQQRTPDGWQVLPTRLLHGSLYAADVREPGLIVLVDRQARIARDSQPLPVGPAGALSASAVVLLGSIAAVRRRNRVVPSRAASPGAD